MKNELFQRKTITEFTIYHTESLCTACAFYENLKAEAYTAQINEVQRHSFRALMQSLIIGICIVAGYGKMEEKSRE